MNARRGQRLQEEEKDQEEVKVGTLIVQEMKKRVKSQIKKRRNNWMMSP